MLPSLGYKANLHPVSPMYIAEGHLVHDRQKTTLSAIHPPLQHPKGILTAGDIFLASITDNIVCFLLRTKCLSTMYIWETGYRLVDRLREHRRDVINRTNDLSVPAHFNQANHSLEDMQGCCIKSRSGQPGIP